MDTPRASAADAAAKHTSEIDHASWCGPRPSAARLAVASANIDESAVATAARANTTFTEATEPPGSTLKCVPEPEREAAPNPERAGRAGLGGYPVNLLVAGRRCVVVGGGRIAARKIEALLDAGADVHVVAPDVGDEVRAWADAGRLTLARARRSSPPTSTARGSRPPPPTTPRSTGPCSRPARPGGSG